MFKMTIYHKNPIKHSKKQIHIYFLNLLFVKTFLKPHLNLKIVVGLYDIY